jgi:predicted phage gp36 major capsid-like protein
MSDTKAQLVAEQEAHEAMWREMEESNKTSDEPMSRARFDELMRLHVDLDSLTDISEPFDLSTMVLPLNSGSLLP